MEQLTNVDLTDASFEEFVSFLFDRDIPPETEKREPWYWNTSVTFDAEKILGFCVRLFRAPEFLLKRYAKPQLEAGFWAIKGPVLDCSASEIVGDSDVPLAAREECIRSMFDLFERLFSKEPLDTSVHMWWHSLCYDWECGNRVRERGGEDLELQDIYFQTLARVLAIESQTCQWAALHGLGHLHHPETQKLIDRFIDEHPSISEEQRTYALSAAKFDVM